MKIPEKILITIYQKIYRLDWIKILHNATISRKTSWGKIPVMEWRNASDEVLMAFITECKAKGIFPKLWTWEKKLIKRAKEKKNGR